MLIHFGVVPYLVFDGDYLPSKAATEDDRARRREESRRVGLELHKLGKTSQAHLELQKAVDVTPQMARQLIEELKQMGVQYVVAPYEADAQLAYLERKGIIHGILSEDSDLLVFGAKSLLTKLDQYGDCVEINRSDFTACREISLIGWTDAEFRRMAILSGCDYLASINKMGLKTAYRLVRKHKTIEKILRMLQFDGQYRVPPGYLEAFRQAELTFLHQRVFCPLANALVLNTDLDDNIKEDDLPFIGSHTEPDVAMAVARGDLHPMNKSELLFDKRSKSTPTTPWTSSSKRQAVSTSSELKVTKPIDSFFKPKRTPLAELDPNSFTPSPSQQRLLQQNNGSWSSSPAPSRPSLSGSSASLRPSVFPTPQSQPVRSQRADEPTQPRPVFAPYPSKRQRLCSDVAEGGASSLNTPRTDSGRSRFFGSSAPGPSPSIRKVGSRKKSKQPDVSIWSDDSIEDVMAGLPDISDFAQPVKIGRIPVFADENDEGTGEKYAGYRAERSITVECSGLSATTTATTQASESVFSQSTMANSSASSGRSQSAAKTLDDHASAELKALRDRFSYQPLSKQSPIETLREPDESHVLPGHQSIPGASNESAWSLKQPYSNIQPRMEGKRSMTPLQRLAAGALTRSEASDAKKPTSMRSIVATPRANAPQTVRCLRTDELVGKSLQLSQSTRRTNGSEDMIIPDSEEESDGASPSDGENAVKPLLDLGRFAFIAT